jgi:hypothetical protein
MKVTMISLTAANAAKKEAGADGSHARLGRCWTDAVQVATVGKPQVIQMPGTLSARLSAFHADAGDVSSGLAARHSLFRDDEIGKAGGHARHHFGGNRMGGPISSSASCYPSEPFRG